MSLADRLRRWTVWPMLWKEFLQLRRDRITFAMMTGLPAIQLLLFGYAIQTDVRKLPTVVVDDSRTSESRALIQVLENTDNFKVVARVPDRGVARRWIERGAARVALVIPPLGSAAESAFCSSSAKKPEFTRNSPPTALPSRPPKTAPITMPAASGLL